MESYGGGKEEKRMKKRILICALAALVALLLAPATGAALDNGMEGLWVGSDSSGQITLMLGIGGTYIFLYNSDQAYRQAGAYWPDQDNMYLSSSDGTDTTLQYGFSEGYLYLSSDGDEVELQRQNLPDLSGMTGVWIVEGEDGSDGGLIGMDASGGFVSVDSSTGEAEKGIYLLDQGDILISFQDGSAMQMGCEVSDEGIVFTNSDTGDTMTLRRYDAPAGE
jgi:hypothetical protein